MPVFRGMPPEPASCGVLDTDIPGPPTGSCAIAAPEIQATLPAIQAMHIFIMCLPHVCRPVSLQSFLAHLATAMPKPRADRL